MKDPIVIDPPGFSAESAWKECHEFVEQCGGVHNEDGSPNWRAAFGADPGCCCCPKCKEYYWMWGRVIQCSTCGFKFPTNWWPSYADGVQTRHGINRVDAHDRMYYWYVDKRDRNWSDPCFRYGFEHPVEEAWEERDKIDWTTILGIYQ